MDYRSYKTMNHCRRSDTRGWKQGTNHVPDFDLYAYYHPDETPEHKKERLDKKMKRDMWWDNFWHIYVPIGVLIIVTLYCLINSINNL